MVVLIPASVNSRVRTAFILTLIGSILNLVTGLFILIVLYVALTTLTPQVPSPHHLGPMLFIPAMFARAILPLTVVIILMPGTLGLIAALLIMYGHLLAGGLLAIIAALTSIPIMLGSLLVGFITLLIGGILALTRS